MCEHLVSTTSKGCPYSKLIPPLYSYKSLGAHVLAFGLVIPAAGPGFACDDKGVIGCDNGPVMGWVMAGSKEGPVRGRPLGSPFSLYSFYFPLVFLPYSSPMSVPLLFPILCCCYGHCHTSYVVSCWGKAIHPFLFGAPPQVRQLYSYSLLVLIYTLDLLLSSLSDKPVGRWLVRDLHQAWGDSRWAVSPLLNLPAGPLLRWPGVALTGPAMSWVMASCEEGLAMGGFMVGAQVFQYDLSSFSMLWMASLGFCFWHAGLLMHPQGHWPCF